MTTDHELDNYEAYGIYRYARNFLFKGDPETVHERILNCLHYAFAIPGSVNVIKPWFCGGRRLLGQNLLGQYFASPVGLAAGFDKNALLAKGIHAFGFGFAEVGTVTLRPQPGNDKPRIWRLPDEDALVNHLGFNNQGGDVMCSRLEKIRRRVPIAVNIGKNKTTELAQAKQEYLDLLTKVYAVADYIVVNVSSPNTPGLRELQKVEFLMPLLNDLLSLGDRLAIQNGCSVRPILVKIAPELSGEALSEVLKLVNQTKIAGVVATNTLQTEKGGKSGRPLFATSLKRVEECRGELAPEKVIVGVGGIFSPEDALAFLRAGANLIQVYTGWVYRGPSLVKRINQFLEREVQRSGVPDFQSYVRSLHNVSS